MKIKMPHSLKNHLHFPSSHNILGNNSCLDIKKLLVILLHQPPRVLELQHILLKLISLVIKLLIVILEY